MKKLPELPHGQGSLSYKAHGSKCIRYRKQVGKTAKKRLEVYGNTVDECMQAMKAAEEKYLREEALTSPELIRTQNIQFQEAVKYWLDTYKASLKVASKYAYDSTWKTHIKGTPLGRKKVSSITSSDIQNHLTNITKTRSERTGHRTYILIKGFCDWAFDGVYNPITKVKSPKKPETYTLDSGDPKAHRLKTLSDSEIRLLEQELMKPPVPMHGGYLRGRFLLFMLFSYIRYGEAAALQLKDIDVSRSTINIYKSYTYRTVDGKSQWILQPPKSPSSRREIRITKKAMDYLQMYIQERKPTKPNDLLLITSGGNPVPSQKLRNELSKAIKRAGITTKINVHGLRHTGISYYIRHGIDIKYISETAGHSNVGITMRVYYEVVQEQKDREWERMNAIDSVQRKCDAPESDKMNKQTENRHQTQTGGGT